MSKRSHRLRILISAEVQFYCEELLIWLLYTKSLESTKDAKTNKHKILEKFYLDLKRYELEDGVTVNLRQTQEIQPTFRQ